MDRPALPLPKVLPTGFSLVASEPAAVGSDLRVDTYATPQYLAAAGATDPAAKAGGLGPVIVVRRSHTEPLWDRSVPQQVAGRSGKAAVVDGMHPVLALQESPGVWMQVAGTNASAALVAQFAEVLTR